MIDRLPGAPYNPLSAEEVESKFLSLSTPVLGKARAQSVVDGISDLENLQDVAAIVALLRG